MSDLFLIFLTPEMLLFLVVCAYIYGIVQSILKINDANKKPSLTEEEKKKKTNAIIVLSLLIAVPIVVYVAYKIYDYYDEKDKK
jgi:hypothetical protein